MPIRGKYRLLQDEDAYYFGFDRVVRNADAFLHHCRHRALLVVHPDIRIVEANEEFCFLTGFLEDELCETPLSKLLPDFDTDPYWALDSDPFPIAQSLNLLTQNGKILEVQVQVHLAINLLERRYLVLVLV